MVDGIDGSGKGTIIESWKKYLSDQGNAIFDLKKYIKDTGQFPELSEPSKYDFIFSAEPTFAGIGKVIRDELIKKGTNYPIRALAEAYSLDRLVLYTKMIIPLLRDNRVIIQDRGVSSSICYQSIDNAVPFEENAILSGNKLALEFRPDHLVIVNTDPLESVKRLQGRSGKNDNSFYEQLENLKKESGIFLSPEYQKFFADRGTVVHHLNGNEKIGIMNSEAITLLKQLLT